MTEHEREKLGTCDTRPHWRHLQMPDCINWREQPAQAPLTPYGKALEQRVSDYRSGYSAGYSDGKNRGRMRDKYAASLFFNIGGVPDVSEYCLDQGEQPAQAEPLIPAPKIGSNSVTYREQIGEMEAEPEKCPTCNGYHLGGCHRKAQAGDERQEFEKWWKLEDGDRYHGSHKEGCAWRAWQARAKLGQCAHRLTTERPCVACLGTGCTANGYKDCIRCGGSGMITKPNVSWEYVGEELAVFWDSPYGNGKEKIATFWWPCHPIEATEEVEGLFEGIANALIENQQCAHESRLEALVKVLQDELETLRGPR